MLVLNVESEQGEGKLISWVQAAPPEATSANTQSSARQDLQAAAAISAVIKWVFEHAPLLSICYCVFDRGGTGKSVQRVVGGLNRSASMCEKRLLLELQVADLLNAC